MNRSRRTVLASLAALSAGCLGTPGGSPTESPTASPTESPHGDSPATLDDTASDTATPPPPTIDAVDGAWPHPAFDAGRTRYDPAGSVPEQRPRTAWTASTDGAETGQVVVGGGRAFFGGRTDLLAFDAASGDRAWRRSFDSERAITGPVLGESVYVTVDDAVVALSPADGSERWRATVGPDRATTLVPAGGTLYVATEDTIDSEGVVAAVESGAVRWSTTGLSRDSRFREVAVAGDTVFAIGTANGSATTHYAFDRDTGEQRWTATGISHSTALTVADGTVLTGGFYGNVLAQSAADGGERWEVDPGPAIGSIGVADGAVYAAGNYQDGPELHAHALADGSPRWQSPLGSNLLAAGDGIVALGGDLLRGLDREDGSVRWERQPPGGDAIAVALADGVLFVASDDGKLRALV